MIWLASRCVGLWPSGAPLVLAPHTDDPAAGDRDDFLYRDDPDGLACPLGAHVRRTNPRDVIKPYATAQSLSMSESHRLLRRGRAFGTALFDPAVLTNPTNLAGLKALLELADDGNARGIHFFCVNASIASQFEFVQQTWCNNPRFGGLNDNKDPITGDNARIGQSSSHMTIPQRPFRVRTAALPRFVKVRGGAYLFMPSLTALRITRTIIEPFRIKSVEAVKFTTRAEREAALAAAGYNVFRLRAEDVLIDLLTDSGTGAMSSAQWGAHDAGRRVLRGQPLFYRFEQVVRDLTGFKHIIPTHQGRAAERILFHTVLKPGEIVPNNNHFDTTRANIEVEEAEALDLVIPEGRDPRR